MAAAGHGAPGRNVDQRNLREGRFQESVDLRNPRRVPGQLRDRIRRPRLCQGLSRPRRQVNVTTPRVDFQQELWHAPVDFQHEDRMPAPAPADIPYGTLDLMVLKTLQTMGRQHGYGVARRIEQMARGVLTLNQGTIYPALLRLEQQGLITSGWGTSENNRRAKFYEITRAGEKHLAAESKHWARMVTLITGLLES